MENHITIGNMRVSVLEEEKELMYYEHHAIINEDVENQDKFSSRLKQAITNILNKIKELIIKAKNWIVTNYKKAKATIIKKYNSIKQKTTGELKATSFIDIYESAKRVEYAGNGLISAMAFATHDLALWIGRIESAKPESVPELLRRLQESLDDINGKAEKNKEEIEKSLIKTENTYSSRELQKLDAVFNKHQEHSDKIYKSYDSHLTEIRKGRDKVYNMSWDKDTIQAKFKLSGTIFSVLTSLIENQSNLASVQIDLQATMVRLKAKLTK
jgi:hypothetical protein